MEKQDYFNAFTLIGFIIWSIERQFGKFSENLKKNDEKIAITNSSDSRGERSDRIIRFQYL